MKVQLFVLDHHSAAQQSAPLYYPVGNSIDVPTTGDFFKFLFSQTQKPTSNSNLMVGFVYPNEQHQIIGSFRDLWQRPFIQICSEIAPLYGRDRLRNAS